MAMLEYGRVCGKNTRQFPIWCLKTISKFGVCIGMYGCLSCKEGIIDIFVSWNVMCLNLFKYIFFQSYIYFIVRQLCISQLPDSLVKVSLGWPGLIPRPKNAGHDFWPKKRSPKIGPLTSRLEELGAYLILGGFVSNMFFWNPYLGKYPNLTSPFFDPLDDFITKSWGLSLTVLVLLEDQWTGRWYDQAAPFLFRQGVVKSVIRKGWQFLVLGTLTIFKRYPPGN